MNEVGKGNSKKEEMKCRNRSVEIEVGTQRRKKAKEERKKRWRKEGKKNERKGREKTYHSL